MTEIDNLTDSELRSKLIEYGFPVMPITGTTRGTMVRKLKLLVATKSKAKDRRSLGRFSSEEESEPEAPRRAAKPRRATLAPMQPPADRARPAARRDEFDTGSESDEVAERGAKAAGAEASPAERIQQIRSRLSLHSAPVADLAQRPLDEALQSEEATPYLSNFTRRLSQLRDSPKDVKENDSNGASTTSSKSYLNSYRTSLSRRPTSSYTDYKPNYGQTNAHLQQSRANVQTNNFISFTVLIVAFLFFLIIGLVYLGISSDAGPEITAILPLCTKTGDQSNCIHETNAKPAIHLLKVLKPELEKRAIIQKCQEPTFKPYMTETEIIYFIQSNYAIKNATKIEIDLKTLEQLTFSNPNWGIQLLQLKTIDENYSNAQIATNFIELLRHRDSKPIAFILIKYELPWKCILTNSFGFILNVLKSLIGGVLVLYLVNYAFKRWQTWRVKQAEELTSLVENIIEIIENHACNNIENQDDNYLVINHIRDLLLPIAERKIKHKLWLKAIDYINSNESRVRCEVQLHRGEPMEVWRWLGEKVATNRSNIASKIWQGQAFEMEHGSVNSLQCSPSSCLKIRGMMDEGDLNGNGIKKAVLAKCPNDCRILHCEIDPKMNCVYLKCVDTNDAAIAYRNLHGWWYAGNLVTVKYLRLERYMQRFPNSPANGPPFLQ